MALIRILSSAVATLASQDFKRLDCKEKLVLLCNFAKNLIFFLAKTSKLKNMTLLNYEKLPNLTPVFKTINKALVLSIDL